MGKKLDQLLDDSLDQVSGGIITDVALVNGRVNDIIHRAGEEPVASDAVYRGGKSPVAIVQDIRQQGELQDQSQIIKKSGGDFGTMC